jgi:hypothetical protein
MTTMNTSTTKQRLAIGLAAIVIALGGLDLFVQSFERGDADALAQRQMVLADKAERAREYRQLHEGRLQVATTTGAVAPGAMAN